MSWWIQLSLSHLCGTPNLSLSLAMNNYLAWAHKVEYSRKLLGSTEQRACGQRGGVFTEHRKGGATDKMWELWGLGFYVDVNTSL
jgi:hypothetical protein